VFGSRDDISGWRIDYHDAAPGRCFDIDIINSDSGTPNDFQGIRDRQDLACYLRFTANNERRILPDPAFQLFGLHTVINIDVRLWQLRAQQIYALLRDAISYKYVDIFFHVPIFLS
jgi:hypothetical protein